METKKQKIISIVATIGVILTLVGATYAYFQAQVGEGKSTDVNINASTVDVFTFATGDAVTISLDQDNFAQGTGSRTASTYASATLSANNKTNTATEHYYLYLNITNNSFDYTSEDSKPEILVKIKKNDIEVTSGISGLSYKTVTDAKGNTLTGFDITNKAGLITIADNTEITTTSTTEDNWNIEVTYVNHDFDQSANAGKSFSAKVLIQKEKQSLTLASWVKEEYAAQTVGNETIYYHDSTLENGAGDNSYRYSGSSSSVNNYVCFGSDEDTCPHDNLYRIIGVFDDRVRLIKADYATSAMLGTDTGDYYNIYSDAGYDTSYYQGESSNLTNIAGYYWNKVNYNASYNATNYYNDWSYSELNKTHLNKNYISYLDNINTKWADMIDTTTWKVGGFNTSKVVPSTLYTKEITSPSTQVTSTYESKIGLMYVSDYGFAASPTAWTTTLYNYNGNDTSENKITEENWMYIGLVEWTIAHSSFFSNFAYSVGTLGYVIDDIVDGGGRAVRPVFHLTSKVIKLEGSGELENPVRIGIGA